MDVPVVIFFILAPTGYSMFHLTFVLITAITFVVFFIEALIHFNIGRNGNGEKSHTYIRLYDVAELHVPTRREFFKIAVTVLMFSTLTGFISSYVIRHHLV